LEKIKECQETKNIPVIVLTNSEETVNVKGVGIRRYNIFSKSELQLERSDRKSKKSY